MLAKYLIAAGIEVADPNQVSGTIELDAPATSLAVAPQRTYFGWPASIVFTSDGSDRIEARDAPRGELVAAWDAPDEGGEPGFRLRTPAACWSGSARTGTIATFDLTAFLAQQGERAPPPASAGLETGMDGVLQIAGPDHRAVLVVRGPTRWRSSSA